MKPVFYLLGAIALAILAIAGLQYLNPPIASSDSSAESGNVLLNASENSYDFGSISMARGPVTKRFEVRSVDGAVRIGRMYTSCMCTSAKLILPSGSFGPFGMPGHGIIPRIGAILGRNETAFVDVTFDPSAHGPAGIGRIERVVSLEAENGAPLQLNIAATVTP